MVYVWKMFIWNKLPQITEQKLHSYYIIPFTKLPEFFLIFLYLFSYLEDIFANKRAFSRNHPYKIQKISISYFHFCKKFQFIIWKKDERTLEFSNDPHHFLTDKN